MRREDKYPNTNTFTYTNENPKNRITTDCVIRAITTGTGGEYRSIVMALAEMQCETGYDDGDAKLYDRFLQSRGWTKHRQPRKEDGTKYTGREFCEAVQRGEFPYTHIIANIGGNHVTAITYGRIRDIFDCSDKCIGNYWTDEQ